MAGRTRAQASTKSDPSDPLYFFPERTVTMAEARALLAGKPEERADVVSHLLRFAQWEDIWRWVDRDEVRVLLPDLDLPENLRAKWAHLLKVETAVSP